MGVCAFRCGLRSRGYGGKQQYCCESAAESRRAEVEDVPTGTPGGEAGWMFVQVGAVGLSGQPACMCMCAGLCNLVRC